MIQCATLSNPTQGSVLTSDEGMVVGVEASYTCLEGFMLVGDEVRVCEEDGRWTGNEPSCVPSK